MKTCISLFDKTGFMLEPWARAGYNCINVDLTGKPRVKLYEGGGRMEWFAMDVKDFPFRAYSDIRFIAAFPDCTDLTRAGAKHWEAKAAVDPEFQTKSIAMVDWVYETCESIGAPFVIENPPGKLSTEWRPPHDIFSPHEYGALCPPGPHPLYPRYWPERDAYSKVTCVWFGNDFVMPLRGPATMIDAIPKKALAFTKLGGKTRMVKDIRSATPRGFAEAVYLANGLQIS